MRSAFLPFLIMALFAPTDRPEGTAVGETVTVIRAGALLDGRSDPPRRNQVIVVRGPRIEAVGDAASTPVPAGATIVDLSASTVLPGLVDSHTHVFLQGEDPKEG